MYSGEAAVVGKVMRGFFEKPGIDAATKSAVYKSLEKAFAINEQAKATGKELDKAIARMAILEVAKAAVEELKKNPDETVKQDAERAAVAVDAALESARKALEKASGTTVPATTETTAPATTVESTVPATTVPSTTTTTTTTTTTKETTTSPAG